METKQHRKEKDHKIVNKVWGYEQWLVNHENYCGKLLVVKAEKCCSFHRHLVKEETFFLRDGKVKLEVGFAPDPLQAKVLILEAGDTFDVPVKMWHRFTAIGGPAMIYEFSTHHSDEDVERY